MNNVIELLVIWFRWHHSTADESLVEANNKYIINCFSIILWIQFYYPFFWWIGHFSSSVWFISNDSMLTSSNSPWWLIICHTERLLTVKLYKSYLPSFCFLTNLFYWQCSAKLQPLFSCCRKSTHWLEFSIVTSNFLLDAAFSSIMAKINKYHYILLSTLLFSFTLSPYFFWETCIFLIFGCVILWICYFICLWFLRIVGGRVKGSGELNRYAFLDLANTILSWISWSRREELIFKWTILS